MMNVGEATCPRTPSPTPIPCVRVVLPAPRSPVSTTRSPARSTPASASPNARAASASGRVAVRTSALTPPPDPRRRRRQRRAVRRRHPPARRPPATAATSLSTCTRGTRAPTRVTISYEIVPAARAQSSAVGSPPAPVPNSTTRSPAASAASGPRSRTNWSMHTRPATPSRRPPTSDRPAEPAVRARRRAAGRRRRSRSGPPRARCRRRRVGVRVGDPVPGRDALDGRELAPRASSPGSARTPPGPASAGTGDSPHTASPGRTRS